LFHRDANHDAVAEDAGAPGHRAAVAAALADDRGGFARDGGFVNAGDAFADFAIGGNHIAAFAHHEVALLQIRRRNLFFTSIAQAPGHRVLARFAEAVGLGPAAALGDGFSEVGKEHGEPEPDRELCDEAAVGGGSEYAH